MTAPEGQGGRAWTRDDAVYWTNQLNDLRRGGVKTVRETAAKWQGTVAAFLGIFASAAVVKGPSTFEDLGVDASLAEAMLVAVIATTVLAFAALYSTVKAAIGIPKAVTGMTTEGLRNYSEGAAESAATWLWWGRKLTLAAAILVASVFIASLVLSFLAFIAPGSPVHAILRQPSGRSVCGDLVQENERLRLVVGSASFSISQEDSLTVVDRCPK